MSRRGHAAAASQVPPIYIVPLRPGDDWYWWSCACRSQRHDNSWFSRGSNVFTYTYASIGQILIKCFNARAMADRNVLPYYFHMAVGCWRYYHIAVGGLASLAVHAAAHVIFDRIESVMQDELQVVGFVTNLKNPEQFKFKNTFARSSPFWHGRPLRGWMWLKKTMMIRAAKFEAWCSSWKSVVMK